MRRLASPSAPRLVTALCLFAAAGACSSDSGDGSAAVRFVEDGGEVTFAESIAELDEGGRTISFLSVDDDQGRSLKVTTVPELGARECGDGEVDEETGGFLVDVRYLRGDAETGDFYDGHAEGSGCTVEVLEVPASDGDPWIVSFSAVVSRDGDIFNRIILDDGEIEATPE